MNTANPLTTQRFPAPKIELLFACLFSKIETFFQANFPKSLEKSLEKFGKKFRNRSELRKNVFLRPRYVRRFPSFVSTRTFADMATWPDTKMTTLKKNKADPTDVIAVLDSRPRFLSPRSCQEA